MGKVYEIAHPSTERKRTGTHVRCPKCRAALNVTEFGTTREFACSTRKGCGYTYDENIRDARGHERGGR